MKYWVGRVRFEAMPTTIAASLGIGLGVGLGVSVVSLLIALAALPWAFARLPVDYLQGAPAPPMTAPLATLGVLLLVAGLAMIVLPGQGLLTMLAGLVLLDFPGKTKLERRMLRAPRMLHIVNRLRRRAGAPPLASA